MPGVRIQGHVDCRGGEFRRRFDSPKRPISRCAHREATSLAAAIRSSWSSTAAPPWDASSSHRCRSSSPCQKSSASRILRRASVRDTDCHDKQVRNQETAKLYCRKRADELKLEMKVSRVDFSLDSQRARFYFTAESRVDFRRLVRDLSKRFSAKVKMIQVGARTRLVCWAESACAARTLCCSTWLKDFSRSRFRWRNART